MRKLVLTLLAFVFSTSAAFAVSYNNNEDRIMVWGIRPMGMGGAFTAVADDENAVFYNPAGISQRQSWLLQILSVDIAVNTETIDAYNDISKILSDENSGSDNGMSISGVERLTNDIDKKDLDLSISVLNLFYISGPFKMGNNSFHFGIGEYSFAEVGASVDFTVPDYIFKLAKLSEQKTLENGDIFSNLPPDIIKQLGCDLSIPAIQAAIAAGNWQEIYDNLDPEAKQIVDDMEKGNMDLEKVISELEKRLDLDNNLNATAVVNTYATAIIDAPLAYRITQLPTIGDFEIPGELSLGVNLKYINRVKAKKLVSLNADDIGNLENSFDSMDLAVLHGQGFGVDLGTIYHLNPQWNFGLQLSDAYTQINYDRVLFKYSKNSDNKDFTHTSIITPELNFGLAYVPEKFYYWIGKYFDTKNRFTFAVDIRDLGNAYEPEFEDKVHMGAEWRFSPFALRAGLNKFKPAFGVGIELDWIQIAYAFYGDESYLAKAFGNEKTVYYHEVLFSIKLGHHDGKAFGNDAKRH
ncbi:MAG: hypothetical protein LBQ37_02090 [Elusimicrobiota bacterium]|jgi:hypothetical protein|nr:hypothetical protein [Elusimicrobiota bacterium]